MANTYTQIHIQIVFAVQGKLSLISEKHRPTVEKYICGIVKTNFLNRLLFILNQPEHHKKTTFKEEYLKILKQSEIGYDEQYLFEWY